MRKLVASFAMEKGAVHFFASARESSKIGVEAAFMTPVNRDADWRHKCRLYTSVQKNEPHPMEKARKRRYRIVTPLLD